MDIGIVQVSPSGMATAIGPGTAGIVMSLGDTPVDTHPLVVHQRVAAVTVALTDTTAIEVDSITAIAVLVDPNGFAVHGRTVEWTTDDTARATITAEGLLITRRQGIVNVTATVEGFSATAQITVTDGFLVSSISATPAGGGACAVTLERDAYCWFALDTARAQGGNHKWLSVSKGYRHNCGVDTAGAAWCWGLNNYGQLGDGTISSPRDDPIEPGGGLAVSQIVASAHDFTCAIEPSGTPLCWGHNDRHQLGRGHTSHHELTIEPPVGAPPLVTLDAGGFHV